MATKASNVAILNAMRSEYELENRLPVVTQSNLHEIFTAMMSYSQGKIRLFHLYLRESVYRLWTQQLGEILLLCTKRPYALWYDARGDICEYVQREIVRST